MAPLRLEANWRRRKRGRSCQKGLPLGGVPQLAGPLSKGGKAGFESCQWFSAWNTNGQTLLEGPARLCVWTSFPFLFLTEGEVPT